MTELHIGMGRKALTYSPDQVITLVGAGNYTYITLPTGRHLVAISLSDLCWRCRENPYLVRVHKGSAVDLRHVKELVVVSKKVAYFILVDGTQHNIARRSVEDITNRWQSYLHPVNQPEP